MAKLDVKAWVNDKENIRRVSMTVVGVLVCGFGVSLCRMAAFGVDPFQSLCSGVYNVTESMGIPQGTMYIAINAVLLIAVLIYNRHYIGLGTLINMFLLGYVADYGERWLKSMFPTVTLAGQIAFLAAAILVLCFSSALYITADLGVSTYDAVALQLEKVTGKPYRYLRIGTDLICVGIGWALGYAPGVCTIITALFMGPLTDLFRRTVGEPMRYGRKVSK